MNYFYHMILSFETTILSTSILSILNILFVFVFIEVAYFDLFVVEIYAISTQSYTL